MENFVDDSQAEGTEKEVMVLSHHVVLAVSWAQGKIW